MRAAAVGSAALLAVVLAAALATAALAQDITGFGGGSGGPLQIQADQGIEWRRDEQVYVARGNATASRGGVTVRADRLVAHYREQNGNTQIYRVEAVGTVEIRGDSGTAYGDRGVYDVEQRVVVLTGGDLRLVTDQDTITAEESLEYWQAKNMAVARGDAVATRGERTIKAEVLTAHFAAADQAGGDGAGQDGDQRRLQRIEAFRNVRISTPQEFVRGDKGVYNVQSRVATLVGDVKITRGENQLNGGYAEVNLETGVSRLLGGPPDSGPSARVKGLLAPDSAGGDALPGGDGAQ